MIKCMVGTILDNFSVISSYFMPSGNIVQLIIQTIIVICETWVRLCKQIVWNPMYTNENIGQSIILRNYCSFLLKKTFLCDKMNTTVEIQRCLFRSSSLNIFSKHNGDSVRYQKLNSLFRRQRMRKICSLGKIDEKLYWKLEIVDKGLPLFIKQ